MKKLFAFFTTLFLLQSGICNENAIIMKHLNPIIPGGQKIEWREHDQVTKSEIALKKPTYLHFYLEVIDSKCLSKETIEFYRDIIGEKFFELTNIRTSMGLRYSITPNADLNEDGYIIEFSDKEIAISSPSEVGLFYATQSLKQLLLKESISRGASIPIYNVIFSTKKITDKGSKFSWRGMHLDVSRHFYTKEEIKRYLDLMAFYKLNRFHWHLCDGPGWRVEIKSYPRLTDVGAWRKDKTSQPWNWRATEISKDPLPLIANLLKQGKNPEEIRLVAAKEGIYGGYYSQEDIKEIVAYAQKRHIVIVPEIELPGHSFATLLAYPELACPTNNISVDGLRGKDVVCAGKDNVFTFFEKVFDEIIELFPGSPIHIGADEVPKDSWKNCPCCQKRMKDLKLKNYDELQSYFVRKIAQYIQAKGRQVWGWDEIMDGGLPQGVGVTVWRAPKFGIPAAKKWQAPTVMCPQNPCYFNFRNIQDKSNEPPAEDMFNTLKQVFTYNPIPKELIGTEFAKNIIGVQANLWTEYVQNIYHADYQLLPRLCALAEIAWNKTSVSEKEFEEFQINLNKFHIPILKSMGYSPREEGIIFSMPQKEQKQ